MSQRFNFRETTLPGLFRVERKPISDHRGYFSRFFCAEEFQEVGLYQPISQINHTLTKQKGAIRGMHFQTTPHTETKIVTCIQGEVLDVAIDIRRHSDTFLHWHAEVLSQKNQSSLYIPDGFAHGFQALTDQCQMFYLHSGQYKPEAEAGLNAFDPRLAIEWPLISTDMSERDRNHPFLNTQFCGVEVK
ncbi:MAG: dTDP-4-dehydrorhamnose 3,5-epimerase [Pseudomonadales bacterium]|nr:dTDP-4-dehydrorhamnose 3,5-epimerase [Pseudomonadales bacterium]